jgi:hypothetical protein
MRLLTRQISSPRSLASSGLRHWWRPGGVAVGATGLAAALATCLLRLSAATLSDPLTFERLLVTTACLVLGVCLGWAWLAVLAVVADSTRSPEPATTDSAARRSRGPLGLPSGVRRLVLALCGVALSAGTTPALAAPPHTDPGSSAATTIESIAAALPFPDRATDAGAPSTRTAAGTRAHDRQVPAAQSRLTVAAGDSLWSIAAARLGDADPAAIDRGWRELYRLNAATIGSDPDRLEPGQRLLLPRSLR